MLAIAISSDVDERELLVFMLGRIGFQVFPYHAYEPTIDNWLENPADLVVLGSSNIGELTTWTTSFREVTDSPLILVVDEYTDRQIAHLLLEGADLALKRPVSYSLLDGYVRALLRRAGRIPALSLPKLQLEEIALNPSTRIVTQAGRDQIQLTQLEFRLLYILMTNRGQVLPFETLIERVWGYSGTGSRELVRGLISRLRSKIEVDPKKPERILTIPGSGYMFSLSLD
jgi:DNA-binding response OmpR family regulator